jgi:hypothetical protein
MTTEGVLDGLTTTPPYLLRGVPHAHFPDPERDFPANFSGMAHGGGHAYETE